MEGKYQQITMLHQEAKDKIHNVMVSVKNEDDRNDLIRLLSILDELVNVTIKPDNNDSEENTKN